MNYTEFKDRVIAKAESLGLAEYELYYSKSDSVSVSTMMHDIKEFSTDGDEGVCFRCIVEGRMGYASTELLDEAEAERIVSHAVANAQVIESDDPAFIHESGDKYEDLPDVKTEEPTTDELISAARDLEEMLYKEDGRVIEGSRAMMEFGKNEVALYNSKGLDLHYSNDATTVVAMAVVRANEELYNNHEIKEIDYKERDLKKLAEESVKGAVDTIGAETVPTGTYDLVISSDMMAALLNTFFCAFSAEDAQNGISLLAGKEGTEVASKLVTIVDDPFIEETLNRAPFDGEGVATKRNVVVENGKLVTLLHDLTTAHKAGVKSTGNGRKISYASQVSVSPYNFFIENGDAGTKEDIFAKVGSGIYLTELNGRHAGANPVTGDFSLSSAGFVIEDGKKGRPARNFTVSGNFYDILKAIDTVGSDLKFSHLGSVSFYGSPTVVVRNIAIAGK